MHMSLRWMVDSLCERTNNKNLWMKHRDESLLVRIKQLNLKGFISLHTLKYLRSKRSTPSPPLPREKQFSPTNWEGYIQKTLRALGSPSNSERRDDKIFNYCLPVEKGANIDCRPWLISVSVWPYRPHLAR